MLFSRSSPVVRSLARRSFSPQLPTRLASRTAPLRNSSSLASTPAGGSSDLPWIIGSVGFTVPAVYYLLSSGSPKPKHSDPHARMDTASTSPGPNVQTHPPEEHQELNAPGENKTEADDKEAPPVEEEGASSDDAEADKETSAASSSDEVASVVRETAAQARGKASDITKRVKEAASDATDRAKEKVGNVAESAKEKAEDVSKSAGGSSDDDEKAPPKKTDKNPQKYDPGDIAMKDTSSMNHTSGKQQGLSNDDTWHAVLHEPHGDAISKKAEGVHDTAKLKGTVDVNRPGK
ncbi:hypothetical protein BDD12DRAFT_887548 [Trichophaea hybrida]|nr:hypothetical protein BDD12DRAFT_887548 [Trichophaea hybrida]